MPTTKLDKIKVNQRILNKLNNTEAADSEHSDPEETNNADVINEETTDYIRNNDSDSDDLPTTELDIIKVDMRQKNIKKAAVPNHYNPMQINNTNILKGESTDCEASNDSDSDIDTMLATALDENIEDQKPNGMNKENYVNVEEMEDTDQKKEISKSEKPKLRRIKHTENEITKYFDVFRQTLEDQIAEIKDRQFSATYQNATLRCTICFQVFFYQHSFELHMKKHHPSSGPVACEACGLRFRNRTAMTQHKRCHKFKFVCKICHEVLNSGTDAEKHRDLHTGVTFECKHCLETFRLRKTYMGHLLNKHPSQYICNICGNSSTNEKGLNQHKLNKHREITEADVELIGPTCDTCDLKFKDQAAFDKHLVNSSNHNDGSHSRSCSECGIPFDNLNAFAAHRKQEHPHKDARLVPAYTRYHKGWPKQCRYCSEMIPSARENWFHHRRNHPHQEYRPSHVMKHSCHICGYKTANSGILKYHIMEKHSTERPHACPQCPKRFSNINKYKCHLRSHCDLRPYVCRLCSAVFKTKHNVQEHEKTVHSGRRAFACKYCEKAFRTRVSRYTHERYVHRKVPQPPRKKRRQTPI